MCLYMYIYVCVCICVCIYTYIFIYTKHASSEAFIVLSVFLGFQFCVTIRLSKFTTLDWTLDFPGNTVIGEL